MKELFVALSLLVSGSLAHAATELPVPQLETLPNGLEIAWFLSDKLPVIDLALLVRSGARDDAAGKSGTAELASALLDRGVEGMDAAQLSSAIEMLGASRSVSTDEDTTTVSVHGLALDAETLLGLLAKMSLKPTFPPNEFGREHGRLLDRWARLADYGDSLASLAYRRLLTQGTSYARGNFLSVEEFANVTRDDVAGFHARHFVPGNAILAIVGRIDKKDEFRKKLLATFGAWQGTAPAQRSWKPFTDKRLAGKQAIVLVDRPGLSQVQVKIGFRAPPLKDPDHYPLVVGNALFGEYFESRLNSLIRDKLGLTYGIGSSFSYDREFASFTISSSTQNATVGPMIQKTIELLKSMKDGPVGAEEVATAKEYLIGGFPLGTATLGAVASRWLLGYVFGMGPSYLNEFMPKVTAVSQEQVARAFAKHVDLKNLVIVVAGDAKAIEKPLVGLKMGKVRVVTQKDLM